MQCNVVISGDVCFIGLKTDRIPGATFTQKRAMLMLGRHIS